MLIGSSAGKCTRAWAITERAAPDNARSRGGLDRRKARDQLADRDARFHARERHARASMDAGTEGEMPVRLATYVKPVGIGELCGIAIGSADRDMHIGAGLHWRAAERGVVRRAAVAELVRALHAQEFFDCGIDQLGMRA
jgi:hypothetical protein